MKRLYIKYQTPVGKGWADTATGFNIYSTNDGRNINRDYTTLKAYNQIAQEYHRTDYRVQIFAAQATLPDYYLSIGFPTTVENQTVGIAPIDLNFISSVLENPNYNEVYFAFNSNENPNGAGDIDVVTKSSYYSRNLETGKLVNLKTDEVIEDPAVSLTFWYTVKQVRGTLIYYMIVNPELVAIFRDIDCLVEDVEYRVLDDNDGSFSEALMNSTIEGGQLISKDLIYATSDTLVIDVLGNSIIHGFSGQKLPPSSLPPVDLVVESSLPYTVKNNLITLDMSGKSTGYVAYKWVTGTTLDASFVTDDESLIRKHVIIK